MSLRGELARTQRFTEAFFGYAYAEDREFSFRLGRAHPLFLAPQIEVFHNIAPSGRPDMRTRGRVYVTNSLYIASHSVEGGAGTLLLVGYDFVGTILLYTVWSVLSGRRGNLLFAIGVIEELACRALGGLRKLLCAC
jgi:GT2 family glycosyltransferase